MRMLFHQSGGVGFVIVVTLIRLNERMRVTHWMNQGDYIVKILLKLIGHV